MNQVDSDAWLGSVGIESVGIGYVIVSVWAAGAIIHYDGARVDGVRVNGYDKLRTDMHEVHWCQRDYSSQSTYPTPQKFQMQICYCSPNT